MRSSLCILLLLYGMPALGQAVDQAGILLYPVYESGQRYGEPGQVAQYRVTDPEREGFRTNSENWDEMLDCYQRHLEHYPNDAYPELLASADVEVRKQAHVKLYEVERRQSVASDSKENTSTSGWTSFGEGFSSTAGGKTIEISYRMHTAPSLTDFTHQLVKYSG